MVFERDGFSPWDRGDLDRIPCSATALSPDSPGYSAFREDSVLCGQPDKVVRPETEADVQDILAFAHARNIPVTVAAGQTGMAGGAVAEEGILLSVARLKNVQSLEVLPGNRARVTVQSGCVLGELQQELEAQGWLYPPDPTSRHEALLGGTLATNATGEDSLFYGPTRRWVQSIRVVTTRGEIRQLYRGEPPPGGTKTGAGYCLRGEPIDWFLGSEGTLGVITQATLELVPLPENVAAGLAFFDTLEAALQFVVSARHAPRVDPRALELMDAGCLGLLKDNRQSIAIPAQARAAVVFKQELLSKRRDTLLDRWLKLVQESAVGGRDLSDATLFCEARRDKERLRSLRHQVPASLLDRVQDRRDQGGAKVGTDWWVPYERLPPVLCEWRRRLDTLELEHVVFGHVGNGHPHVNMMTRNGKETELARGLVREMCRDAVSLGGGVAGEHGLGKLKRDLLAIQYPSGFERMRALKREWDPRWILGRGNLFLPEEM